MKLHSYTSEEFTAH